MNITPLYLASHPEQLFKNRRQSDQMDFSLSYSKRFDGRNRSIVLNCGKDINLPDGSVLGNFVSGLFEGIEFEGDKLIILEVGGDTKVTDKIAEQCRSEWRPVSDAFGLEEFRRRDFYVSERTKLGKQTFSFFYFGDWLSGSVHREHDFFELHTQILGRGSMETLKEKEDYKPDRSFRMEPGDTHPPLFYSKMEKPVYPWHRYQPDGRAIILAIESPYPIPGI